MGFLSSGAGTRSGVSAEGLALGGSGVVVCERGRRQSDAMQML